MDSVIFVNVTTDTPPAAKMATWMVSFPAVTICSLIALLLLYEQLSYLKKKGLVPGPTLTVPFLGSALPMILDPTQYWFDLAKLAVSSGRGFCADYIFGRFIIFIRDSDLSHKIFSNVRSDAFMLIGHPFGRKLFGDQNLIYMFGQEHKNLRRYMAPNFTPRALSTYRSIQQRIILRHIDHWLSLSDHGTKPLILRLLCRDMNLETSQIVFAGPYLNEEERETIGKDYNLFNMGLMTLPLDLPGFAFRKARLAVSRLSDTLAKCVRRSGERMTSGKEEPECLLDFWMQQEDCTDATSSDEIGKHLFDFLFAAQDASTSSLLWAVALLESHPEVVSRVREEVSEIGLQDMKYTMSVALEVIRLRPPATLVPHIAKEDFQLTDEYTVTKGTIVFPSVYESSFQGFTAGDRFDPDRFSDERREDVRFKRKFLAFGAGSHQCVGQRYAVRHLALFIALFVSVVDFKRDRNTDDSGQEDDLKYVPTIAPKDDCKVYLKRREKIPDFN